MAIDDARQERFAPRINDARFGTPQGERIGFGADELNPVSSHDDGLGGGLGRVLGECASVCDDKVGHEAFYGLRLPTSRNLGPEHAKCALARVTLSAN